MFHDQTNDDQVKLSTEMPVFGKACFKNEFAYVVFAMVTLRHYNVFV